MTAARLAALLPLLACLAGCKGSAYWQDRLDANPLHKRAQDLRAGSSCSGLVPLEFGATFPVPVRDGAHGHFEVLFFPAAVAPGSYTVMTPTVQGWFSAGSAAGDRCEKLDVRDAQALGPALPKPLSMAGYYRTSLTLFEGLERAAALYFKGGPLAEGDREALKDFEGACEALAGPGLVVHYYRLSPDFWEWLRKESGRSLPKPAP